MAIDGLNAGSSNGLIITPLRSEYEIDPGTVQKGNLVVTNSSDVKLEVNFSAEEFNVINPNYDYAFTPDSAIAKWVYFDKEIVTLEPNQSEKIQYSINVPLSAEPGGRYISLFASYDNNLPSQAQAISSRQRLASLAYITVNGNVTKLGQLATLSMPWLADNNINWSATIQNTGTTHFRSLYNITIDDMFGNEVMSHSGNTLILPSSVKLVSGVIQSGMLPGLYKATYKIGMGDLPSATEIRLFLYLPSWFLWLILIIISTLVALKYKKKLTKKAS